MPSRSFFALFAKSDSTDRTSDVSFLSLVNLLLRDCTTELSVPTSMPIGSLPYGTAGKPPGRQGVPANATPHGASP